jgi:predicted DsbA family dithiol-disulfide isomerase
VVPPAIAAELERTPHGMVTIVDFVDFECPWCRAMNAELEPVVEAHKSQLRVVRKQVPLRMHPHAMDAARAACCGEQLGSGDAMADELFKSEDLTPAGCEKIAEKLGINLASYRKCVSDPSTDERIRSDSESFRSSKGHGLPTIWIGDQKLEGARERPVIEQAVTEALVRAGS